MIGDRFGFKAKVLDRTPAKMKWLLINAYSWDYTGQQTDQNEDDSDDTEDINFELWF